VRSQLRLACGAIVLMVAICVGGCGGSLAAKTGSPVHAQVGKAVPAYRVGQYCLPSRETKYKAAGLVCKRHHLAR